MAEREKLIELKDLQITFGSGKKKFVAVDHVNFDIYKGETFSLVGESGSGKTTIGRAICRINPTSGGDIFFNEKRINDMDPSKRNIGMVFQSYAIFPHLTVRQNVEYGLKIRKLPRDEMKKRVDEMLKLVRIDEYQDRLPERLSGGQQQRVALARAIVIKPDVLLMDEPLSNLDAKLRVKMRVEIRRIQQELGFTAIYVTHDQEECFAISDKVAIMNKGVIEQMDAPSTIYNSPNTEFIARFVGFENFFELTRAQGGDFVAADGTVIRAAGQKPGERFKGCIRPEDVQVRPAGEKGNNAIPGEVMVSTFLGRHNQLNVKTAIGEFVVSADQTQVFPVGTAVTLVLTENKIKLIG